MVQLQYASADRPIPYRETRFYRQSDTGWLPAAPDEAFWGGEGSLESKYFAFQFRQRDRVAVFAAAPLLDDRYERMLQTLGLPQPVEEKIQVTVVPGPLFQARWVMGQRAIELPSPVLIVAPEAVTEAEVLAEAALHLLSGEAVPMATDIQYGNDVHVPNYINQEVLLWLSWERDNPLSTYRKEIVPWIYSELPLAPSRLPASFQEMCQLIDVWQRPDWELVFFCPVH